MSLPNILTVVMISISIAQTDNSLKLIFFNIPSPILFRNSKGLLIEFNVVTHCLSHLFMKIFCSTDSITYCPKITIAITFYYLKSSRCSDIIQSYVFIFCHTVGFYVINLYQWSDFFP